MSVKTQPILDTKFKQAELRGVPARTGRPNAFAAVVAVLASLWAVICLVAFRGHAGGLWRDEVNSINITHLPTVGDLWRHLDSESFPLLWLLFERAWSSVLGTSDAVLRDVGLATGLALIAALWLCGRRCSYIPVVALALVADNPVLLRVAASNRAYGLGFLLIVLTYHAVWRLAQGPTRRRAVVAALLALAATQTLYYNIVFVTAMLLGALGVGWYRGDRGFWRPLAGIEGLCALSLLPYAFGPIRAERAWSFVLAYKMNFADVLDTIERTLHLQSLSQPCTGGTVIATMAWLALGAACVLALAAYTRPWLVIRWHDGTQWQEGTRWSDEGNTARYASVVFLGSLFGNILVLKLVGYKVEVFHLSALVLLTAVSAGHLISSARPAWVRQIAVPIMALLVVSTNLSQTLQAVKKRQTNENIVASILNVRTKPGDLVLVAPYWLGQSFARYYHGRAPWVTPPTLGQYAIGGEQYILQQMMHPVPDMDHLREIKSVLKSGNDVWLVSDQGSQMLSKNIPILLPLLPPYKPGSHPSMKSFIWRLMDREIYILHHAKNYQGINLRLKGDVFSGEHTGLFKISGWHSTPKVKSHFARHVFTQAYFRAKGKV